MMSEQQLVDITEMAVVGEQFPRRLRQLGFRLMQVLDAAGRDLVRYVLPPTCAVPAGPFLMGSVAAHDPDAFDDEFPQCTMVVPAFHIGTYPVTVAEYDCAVQAGVLSPPAASDITWQVQQAYPDHPVVCISWHEAKAYAAWLAEITRQPWRLPTEVEWEKAARGTDGRIFPWGDQWDETRLTTPDNQIANSIGDEGGVTAPVGSFIAQGDGSPYGAHDLSNILQWTSSIYDEHPPYRPELAENAADTTSKRVLRGGVRSFPAQKRRCAFRVRPLGDFGEYTGTRLALEIKQPE